MVAQTGATERFASSGLDAFKLGAVEARAPLSQAHPPEELAHAAPLSGSAAALHQSRGVNQFLCCGSEYVYAEYFDS